MFYTKGIVLGKNAYREFDEIITLYTKDFGKIEILGRGVKKSSAKLSSHLQNFDLTDVEFVLGRKFRTLTGANLIVASKASVEQKYFFDFLEEMTEMEDANENIWNLIVEFLNFCNSLNAEPSYKNIFNHYFQYRIIALSGFSPRLDICLMCQGPLKEEGLFFSFKEGGIICGSCGKERATIHFALRAEFIIPVLPSSVKIMRIFEKNDKNLLSKIKISNKEEDDLMSVLGYIKQWISN